MDFSCVIDTTKSNPRGIVDNVRSILKYKNKHQARNMTMILKYYTAEEGL
jgi:hypothetical protein